MVDALDCRRPEGLPRHATVLRAADCPSSGPAGSAGSGTAGFAGEACRSGRTRRRSCDTSHSRETGGHGTSREPDSAPGRTARCRAGRRTTIEVGPGGSQRSSTSVHSRSARARHGDTERGREAGGGTEVVRSSGGGSPRLVWNAESGHTRLGSGSGPVRDNIHGSSRVADGRGGQ